MTGVRRLLALATATTLSACTSVGAVAPPASTVAADASHAHRADGRLVVRVRIPRKPHGLGRLDPRYISAATKGMTMVFTGASSFTEVVGLTPQDPRCTGSPLSCTIVLSVAAGKYTVTVDAYDQAPANGAIPTNANVLSTARAVPLTILAGTSNRADFTLDGVPASLVVGGFPNADAGTPLSDQRFSVTAKDADGYAIVGTYTTPVTLVDDDTSGATSIATSGSDNPPTKELLGSSDLATISYTGQTIRPVTIAASAGSAAGSGLFVVTLPVYVAGYSANAVEEIPPGCISATCVTTLGGMATFSLPEGVAVDASGNVYVADTFNSLVQKMPPGCSTSSCVTTIGGGFSGPTGVALDDSGNIFVSDSGNHAVKEMTTGCLSMGCVSSIGADISDPTGIAVDANDDVFISDFGTQNVKEIPSGCTMTTCVKVLGGGFSHPAGIAVDGSGNVFVADLNNKTVSEIPVGCASVTCVTPIGGGFNGPSGAAVDGAGNVYTTDGNAVEEIPPGCVTASCVTMLGGGSLGGAFNGPFGVVIF